MKSGEQGTTQRTRGFMAVSSWKLNLLRGGGAAARFPPHPPARGGFLLNHTSRVFLADRLIRRDASFCGLGPILSIFHADPLPPPRVFVETFAIFLEHAFYGVLDLSPVETTHLERGYDDGMNFRRKPGENITIRISLYYGRSSKAACIWIANNHEFRTNFPPEYRMK